MKTLHILLAAIAALLTIVPAHAQTAEGRVTIRGAVPAGTQGTVYLQKFNNRVLDTVDSATVRDGKFAFDETLPLPELYGLTLDKNTTPYYLFLEQGTVTVVLDPADGYSRSITTGSTLQDEFTAYRSQRVTNISAYIREHPKSLVSAYVLYRDFGPKLSDADIEHNISLLDLSLQGTVYIRNLREYTALRQKIDVGSQAPDFTLPTPDGTPLHLYDVARANKLVLVDFWASWCGPCRRENPNVVRAYRKYHDRGFDIVGVSLDRARGPWLKAIAADSLAWHHVSDLKYWASAPAKAYGVRVIPSNFLIDSTGKIVARNLRGEQLLEFLGKQL